MILLITSSTLHKHYNLILALQLYINRSNTILNPEKKNQMDMYPRQQKYANNNNRQREKQGGIDSIETTFDFFPFFVMEFYLILHKCYSTFYIVYRSDFYF